MTRPSTCSIALPDCDPIQTERCDGLLTYLVLITNAFDYGHSPAQPLSRAMIGAAIGWNSRGQSLRKSIFEVLQAPRPDLQLKWHDGHTKLRGRRLFS